MPASVQGLVSLDRIKASGFKSIREVDLEIRRLNVLIGSNGSGKSNFIGLFRLLNEIVSGRLQIAVSTAGGANALLFFGRKTTPRLTIETTFGLNGYRCELVPGADEGLVFDPEEWWSWGPGQPKPHVESLKRGHSESLLPGAQLSSKVAATILPAPRSYRIYHFHDTGPSSGMKLSGPIDDNERLRPDASNLAAFLYLLQQRSATHYRNIIDVVRTVAPFLKGFNLRPSPLKPDSIKLEWEHVGSDAYFDASALSDGTLRFICLATLLLQPEPPSVVLLDEPELGLHPAAISVLGGLLRSASTRSQVIVSTQSVTLVNQLQAEDLIVVEREGQASTFRRLSGNDLESWLEDYSLGELWEKNVLGGRP